MMGTVHLLECVRSCGSVRSVVNVTTDKVYRNLERADGFREDDVLDGYEPYANSKSCSELIAGAYVRSFLRERGVAASTARAGNVIGGGDMAADRILPDCIRAAERGQAIPVRNPRSVRPYQHVLEPLSAYLLIAKAQYEAPEKAGLTMWAPTRRTAWPPASWRNCSAAAGGRGPAGQPLRTAAPMKRDICGWTAPK